MGFRDVRGRLIVYIVSHLEEVSVGVWVLACREFDKHDSNAPNITYVVVGKTIESFRAPIVRIRVKQCAISKLSTCKSEFLEMLR